MKRILSLALVAGLAFGVPVAMAQTVVTESSISAIDRSLSGANVESAYQELSKMVNATTDKTLLALLAAALTKVAQLATDNGMPSLAVAAAANAAAAQDKANGSAVGEVPAGVGGQVGSPA